MYTQLAMNRQLLIDAVVRQTMVLIAQLATSGGARTPLAHLAHQVFVDLTAELEAQGLSRKVTADMFGISLRSYQRKLNRLHESRTDSGRTLWEAIYQYLSGDTVRARKDVLRRFGRDDVVSVKGILRDLVDSGLAFVSGTGDDAVYRAVRVEEVREEDRLANDTLVWAMIYREGPLRLEELARSLRAEAEQLVPILERLLAAGHVQKDEPAKAEADDTDGSVERLDEAAVYSARQFLVERDASVGWEAAVYDHFQAVVRTICARLDPDTARETPREHVGGSTYSLDIDRVHPLRDQVLGTLERMRSELSELRRLVNEHNEHTPPSVEPERVVLYAGQCVLPQPTES